MWFHSIDYSPHRPDRHTLINRGYFIHGLPRLILACRLRGHRPVVDGYNSEYGAKERSRWVTCDRCGIRPYPQGHLDPDQWNLGHKYTGPFNPTQPMSPTVRKQLIRRGHDASIRLPGAWPDKPTSGVGAQFVLGRTYGTSIDIKVGNPSSEQCLAAHISLGPVGALYVHAEDHARWIQRRLNGRDGESRETGLRLQSGRIEWRIWAPRNHSKASDPRWMRGAVNIDPRHYLFGPRTSTLVQHGDKTSATIHLPDGTSHEVTLRLEELTYGRKRQKKTTEWRVDWSTVGAGIPIRFDRNVQGSDVVVSAAVAGSDQWVQEACTAITTWVTERWAETNYQPASSS